MDYRKFYLEKEFEIFMLEENFKEDLMYHRHTSFSQNFVIFYSRLNSFDQIFVIFYTLAM